MIPALYAEEVTLAEEHLLLLFIITASQILKKDVKYIKVEETIFTIFLSLSPHETLCTLLILASSRMRAHMNLVYGLYHHEFSVAQW